MGRKLIDLTGQKFNRLLVVAYVGRRGHSSHWTCTCDCGNKTVVSRSALVSGTVVSCGCYRSDRAKKLTYKHGERGGENRSRTPVEYKTWDGMKQRCYNPNTKDWPWYGGRGIAVCEEWRNDFSAFLAHVGRRPADKHTIDRIDGDKGYAPGNVRWATWEEQARNRSNNRQVFVDGRYVPVAVAAELRGVPYAIVKSRLQKGWSIERATTTPIDTRKSRTK